MPKSLRVGKKNNINMRKIILMSVLSVSLIANGLYAQGAYVSLNAGYGLGSSSQSLANTTKTSGSSSTITTEENVNLSLGKGLNFGGTFGYMLNKNIGAELGLSYLIGGTTTQKNASTGSSTNYYSTNTDYSASMLRINPSIVIASGLDGINPYAKFGAVIGTGSFTADVNESQTYSSKTSVFKQTTKYSGGLAVGVSASLGASFKLNDKISLFGELALISLSYAPTKGEITAYTENGADKLSSLTTNDKQTDFVDKTTTTSTATPDSQPNQQLKSKYPFGSFGLNIGLKYTL